MTLAELAERGARASTGAPGRARSAPRPARSTSSWCASRPSPRRSPRLWASEPLERLEGVAALPRRLRARAVPARRRSSRRTSTSTAARSPARRSCATAGSAASRSSRACSARPSARSTSSGTSRRRTRTRMEELVAQPRRGVPRVDLAARLDGRGDARQGARQARRVHPEDRLPGPVARLLGARGRAPTTCWATCAAPTRSSRTASWRKIGKPIDRDEWFMTPQTVNAYYNPGMNEIVFPAAILQPPFFDAEADDAVNYGGIGAVIGHEIGHGFDDQGSKYDGDGRLEDWWTADDRAEFETRTERPHRRSTTRSPPPSSAASHHVNGALTIGENIGDLGGLSIALKAYRIALGTPARRGAGDRRADRRAARAARLGAGVAGEGPRRGDRSAGSRPTRTRPTSSAATAWCATSTSSTRRSTCSRATRCTWRPRSASASGDARRPGPAAGRRQAAARTRRRGPAGSRCPARPCTCTPSVALRHV